LKSGEKYQTKIELALEILRELLEFGFKIKLVLADSLYGEASSFIRALDELKLSWIVAIRSNHGVWMSPHQGVRANKWHQFQRYLVIKPLKQDISEKSFLAREVLEVIGK
jgi:SRSO17 transposase